MRHRLGQNGAATAAAALRSFDECGVRSALVGATAWKLQVDWKYDLEETITTKDIDFVVGVSSWEEFRHVRESCLANGFVPGRAEHEIKHSRNGSIVDLVPTGARLAEDCVLTWPESGRVMNMQGAAEALDRAEARELDGGVRLRLPPLEMLVALKIIAHGDRPERNDLLHIDHIFRQWPRGEDEESVFDELLGETGGMEDFAICAGAVCLAKRAVAALPASVVETLHAIAAPLGDPDCPAISGVLRSQGRVSSDEEARRRIARRMDAYARRLRGPA